MEEVTLLGNSFLCGRHHRERIYRSHYCTVQYDVTKVTTTRESHHPVPVSKNDRRHSHHDSTLDDIYRWNRRGPTMDGNSPRILFHTRLAFNLVFVFVVLQYYCTLDSL